MGKRPSLRSTGLVIGLAWSLSFSPSSNRAQDFLPSGEPASESISVVEPGKPDPREADPVVAPTDTGSGLNPAESGSSVEPKDAETAAVSAEKGTGETETVPALHEAGTILESKDPGMLAEPREAETLTVPQEPEPVVGPRETETAAVHAETSPVLETKEPADRGEPLGLIFGLRAGFSVPTQRVIRDLGNSTSTGPLINVEALYAIREWVRAGLMVEWHRHRIKMWGPEFGTLNTVSILPTVELRPTRAAMEERGIEAVVPYASLGLGVNANSLSKGNGLGNATVSARNG